MSRDNASNSLCKLAQSLSLEPCLAWVMVQCRETEPGPDRKRPSRKVKRAQQGAVDGAAQLELSGTECDSHFSYLGIPV